MCLLWLVAMTCLAQTGTPALSGKVISKDKEAVPYDTVRLKETAYGCTANEEGMYFLYAPPGKYTLVVSAVGYEAVERQVTLTRERQKMHVTLRDLQISLDEVVVMGNEVGRVNRSAFNAVAVDARALQNSTKTLSDALAKVPGNTDWGGAKGCFRPKASLGAFVDAFVGILQTQSADAWPRSLVDCKLQQECDAERGHCILSLQLAGTEKVHERHIGRAIVSRPQDGQ